MPSFSASDGTRLAYVVDDWTDPWTVADTRVLLHAAMGSSRRLYAWIPHLAHDFRVVRLDLRGHGQSEVPPASRALTLERLADDVIELLDHLGVARVHLAGSSAGAIVSMAVAIGHPDRVLTLADFASTPGLRPSNVDAAAWVARIRARGLRGFLAETIADRFDLERVDPRFVQWFLDESARTSADWLARFVPLMASIDLTEELGTIRCPMLAVVPAHDPISSMRQYEVIRDRVPDVEFVVYDGLPHNITDAVPDRCAAELRRFLLAHRQARVSAAGAKPTRSVARGTRMSEGATFQASDGLRLGYTLDDFTDPWNPGPPLVLLHAAMGSLERFNAWMPILARDFRIARLDLRGHGGSETPGPDRPITIERYALDVAELMDHLGWASAAVCGTSGGGYPAQYLAATRPERVDRLALYSSTPGLKHSTVHLPTWHALIRDKGVGGMLGETVRDRVDPAQAGGFVQWMIDVGQRMDREFTCRFLTAMTSLDLSHRLPDIRCPTLVVIPGGDTVGTKAGYALYSRIPDVEIVVYEGLAHNITNAVPERCASELRRFLLASR